MGSIDSDAHVIECEATFDYMDPEFEHLKPMVVVRKSNIAELDLEGRAQTEYWVIDGKLQPKEGNIGSNTSKESREMLDVQARLDHMDELEIDVQVLYPTVFLRAWTQNPEIEYALCKSYNRWLADIWSKASERLRWVVMPPLLQMDKVREEIKFAKENGACGIFMRSLENERPISDPYFYPLYDLAGDLDLPISIHLGNGSFMVHEFYDHDSTFSKFKLPTIAAFHSLVMHETPSKFPKVRWGIIEACANWLPYVLQDLRERFDRRGKELPDDILGENNLYVTCEVTDDLPYVMKAAGTDNLIIGTDYGHSDSATEIKALRLLRDKKDIGPEIVDKILWHNPSRYYGLG